MKTKKLGLDVDFIGGQGSLTVEEEKALDDFFRQRKLASKKSVVRQQHRTTKRSKVTA
jgi:hypothetical protein